MDQGYLNSEDTIKAEHGEIAKFLQQKNFIEVIQKEPKRSDKRKKAAVEFINKIYESTEQYVNNFCIDMKFDSSSTGSKIISQINELLNKLCKNTYHISPPIQVFTRNRFSENILCHFACAEDIVKLSNNKKYPANIVTLKEARKRGKEQHSKTDTVDMSLFQIEVFRKKLKEEALFRFSRKLYGKELSDYISLGLEIGYKGSACSYGEAHSPYNHNREWMGYESCKLENPQGVYILSSETGSGKTTFLRNLQLAILEKTKLIPLFLSASDLEKADFGNGNTDNFLKTVSVLFNGYLADECEQKFLKSHLNEIVFLIDGLDQMKGSGTEYGNFVDNLLGVVKDKIVITSRPFAVIEKESDFDIKFLRLENFTKNNQEQYFRESYTRAKELCKNCPDMLCVPMLAYMIWTLIVRGEDKGINNRAQLYDKFISHIFKNHMSKNLELSFDGIVEIRNILGEISYRAIASKKPYLQKIPYSFAKKCLQKRNNNIEIETLLKSGLPCTIINESGGDDLSLYFSHQSFQEYLAAEYIAQDDSRIQQVLSEKWNPKWKEVIKFLTGIKGQEIIKTIYYERDNMIHSKLFLSAELIPESDIDPILKYNISLQIKNLLEDKVFERDALIHWAYLDKNDVLKRIIRKLNIKKNEDFYVSTWVIYALKDRFNGSEIESIIQKAADNDPHISSAAIEVLAYLKDKIDDSVIEKVIIEKVKNREPIVRRAAIWALANMRGRIEDSIILKKVVEGLDDENAFVRTSVIKILAYLKYGIDDGVIRKIVERLADEDDFVRHQAVKTLGILNDQIENSLIENIIEKADDKNPGIHSSAIQVIWELRRKIDNSIIDKIIDKLDRMGCYSAIIGLKDSIDVFIKKIVHRLLAIEVDECKQIPKKFPKKIQHVLGKYKQSFLEMISTLANLENKHEELLNQDLYYKTLSAVLSSSKDNLPYSSIVIEIFVALKDKLDNSLIMKNITEGLNCIYTESRCASVKALKEMKGRVDDNLIITMANGKMDDENLNVRYAAIETLIAFKGIIDNHIIENIVKKMIDDNHFFIEKTMKVLLELKDRIVDDANIIKYLTLLRSYAAYWLLSQLYQEGKTRIRDLN